MAKGALSSHQLRHYRQQGFLVLEAFLDAATLASLRNASAELVSAFNPAQHRSVFRTTDQDQGRDETFFRSAEKVEYFLEDEALDSNGELTVAAERAVNKIGHALHDHIPAFRSFCQLPLLAALLKQLGMAHPVLWQTMLIFKQPGIGGEVRWHQDATYLYTEPSAVMGLWFALEDATRDNGCLWLAPGAHDSPLRERYRVDWHTRRGTLETIHEQPWPTVEEAVPLEVPAGSLVLFSDHMPHYSSANRSDQSRLALTLHAADRSAHWDAANWLQRPTLAPFLLGT